jgi:hypothetical protein
MGPLRLSLMLHSFFSFQLIKFANFRRLPSIFSVMTLKSLFQFLQVFPLKYSDSCQYFLFFKNELLQIANGVDKTIGNK